MHFHLALVYPLLPDSLVAMTAVLFFLSRIENIHT